MHEAKAERESSATAGAHGNAQKITPFLQAKRRTSNGRFCSSFENEGMQMSSISSVYRP